MRVQHKYLPKISPVNTRSLLLLTHWLRFTYRTAAYYLILHLICWIDSLGLSARYSFSCNFTFRALDYFDTGTYNLYLTISINAIPTAITTLLTLSVQVKRLCIATQASYLIRNNKIILSVQRWWYENTYTMHHMYTPQYIHIHCSMHSYHSYTVLKWCISYSNTCSKHILAHTNELICTSTNTACSTNYTHGYTIRH